jgi:hypothetical protein
VLVGEIRPKSPLLVEKAKARSWNLIPEIFGVVLLEDRLH